MVYCHSREQRMIGHAPGIQTSRYDELMDSRVRGNDIIPFPVILMSDHSCHLGSDILFFLKYACIIEAHSASRIPGMIRD